MTQVAIYDYVSHRRIEVSLTADDFAQRQACWKQIDPLLMNLQYHAFFTGRTRWCDLELVHFHAMLVNILHLMDGYPDEDTNPWMPRLVFLLSAIVGLLETPDSTIDLLYVDRMAQDDVVYRYSASVDVEVKTASPSIFRVVFGN